MMAQDVQLNQNFPIDLPGTYYTQNFNMTFTFLENTTISSENVDNTVWTLSVNNSSIFTTGIMLGPYWTERWANSSVISPVNQTVVIDNYTGLNIRLTYSFSWSRAFWWYPMNNDDCINAFLDLSGNPILVMGAPNQWNLI